MGEFIGFDFGGRKSEVFFARGILNSESGIIGYIDNELHTRGEKNLFVFDNNTYHLFGLSVKNRGSSKRRDKRDSEDRCVVLPPGESSKNWKSVSLILKSAVETGLGRNGTIIGIGGGVIGDLAGFAASVYMRGCSLILVPTTLLAMVDASIGGKTGFDFMGLKNMVGSFYPASRIYMDVDSIGYLPKREYLCGLAEAIKTAMLGDGELFDLLENRREDVIARKREVVEEVVRRAVMVKGKIVEEDPRESGKRAWLNLGHTFAHALEAVNEFKGINHGEAVAWGLGRAIELGLELGLTDRAYASRVIALLRAYGFVLEFPAGKEFVYKQDGIRDDEWDPKRVIYDPVGMIRAMYGDKKSKKGKLRFVLQRDLCDNLIVEDVDERTIIGIL